MVSSNVRKDNGGYFISHTTPWEEFAGLGSTQPHWSKVLYEFPESTFGKLRASNSNGFYGPYDVNGTSIGEIKMGVVSVDGEIDNYSYSIGIKSSDNNPNHCFTTDGKTFDLSTKLNASSIGSIDPFDIEILF